MTFIYPGCHCNASSEDDDVDIETETEFYNVPDLRIMDLLKEANFEAE